MDDLFKDDRLQFFLRNREDIRLWAAIEPDVVAAIREMLARTLPLIEERFTAIDAAAVIGRHDSGPWERVMARHEFWPLSTGLALEWHREVDLVGAWPAKIGVFWWAEKDDPDASLARTRFRTSATAAGLQRIDFKVPLEAAWPVGTRLSVPPDWWQHPTAWVDDVVDRLASTWPLAAPLIDEALTSS